MPWDFIWLMFILKIPLVALIVLVWWAVRKEPEPAGTGEDDGGLRVGPRVRHPRPRLPRHPRRGPHGGQLPLPPPRVRTTRPRTRTLGH